MTANAVPGRPGQESAAEDGAGRTVRLVRESFAVAGKHAEDVTKFFYSMLFTLAPETRELFPANMQTQRDRLLRALVHIVQQVDQRATLVPFLEQLARDHRKFGVITRHYESVGIALIAAVKRYAGEVWTEEIEYAWAEAYTGIARIMQEAAEQDEGPAWWPAEVVAHRRVGRDLAIVRVRTDHPVPYQPGQYVSVETPQRRRLWRYLSPANAPSEDNEIEFHVRAVPDGWASGAIVAHAEVGDMWRLGAPIGRLGVDRAANRKVLMVAGGTGLSPMRAILDTLAQYGTNPDVRLFYGGRTLEDLYELDNLRNLAAISPWLTVTAVAEQRGDAEDVEQGTLADAVTRHGAWKDRDVLVAGSPAMLRATVSRMLVAGTALDRIHYDPFTLD